MIPGVISAIDRTAQAGPSGGLAAHAGRFSASTRGRVAIEIVIAGGAAGAVFGSWGFGGPAALPLVILWHRSKESTGAAVLLSMVLGILWGVAGWLLSFNTGLGALLSIGIAVFAVVGGLVTHFQAIEWRFATVSPQPLSGASPLIGTDTTTPVEIPTFQPPADAFRQIWRLAGGWPATFSCTADGAIWYRTDWGSAPDSRCYVQGQCPFLDRIAATVLLRHPIGGRFRVSEIGVHLADGDDLLILFTPL